MFFDIPWEFHELAKNPEVEKRCILAFDDAFFTTEDIPTGGLRFDNYFQTSDDYCWSDCPSNTLSFSVITNGLLRGYKFGKCRPYLGVLFSEEPQQMPDNYNARIVQTIGGTTYTWTASNDGNGLNVEFQSQGVIMLHVSDDEFMSLLYVDGYVYAVGKTGALRCTIDASEVERMSMNAFMAQKLQTPLSVTFDRGYLEGSPDMGKCVVFTRDAVKTYYYVPMGVFNVDRPRITDTDVISIQDAYDDMRKFDVDAATFLENIQYPTTLRTIFQRLCAFVGVEYRGDCIDYISPAYTFDKSPFPDNAITCRQILSWITETIPAHVSFDRFGRLAFYSSIEGNEQVNRSEVNQSGYLVAEYECPEISGIILKSVSGASLSFGSMREPYCIYGNPFISTVNKYDIQNRYRRPYRPIELPVVVCNPAVDCGDDIFFFYRDFDYDAPPTVFVDAFGNIMANERNEAYVDSSVTMYTFPLMRRELIFNGQFRATYYATGNEHREIPDGTEYNAQIAVTEEKVVDIASGIADGEIDEYLTQKKIFDKLTNNGQVQGIYMSGGQIYINAEYIRSGYISANLIEGGTIRSSEINIGRGTFVVDRYGKVTASNLNITGGSIRVGDSFQVTSDGKVTCKNADIGGWLVDSGQLYKTSYSDPHTYTNQDTALIGAVLNGTVSEETVLAQRPYLDIDGDGHITQFDLRLAGMMVLGIIPNGTITSSTARLNANKPLGAMNSMQYGGQGFFAGAGGVYGTAIMGDRGIFSDDNIYSYIEVNESGYKQVKELIQRVALNDDGLTFYDTNGTWRVKIDPNDTTNPVKVNPA